MHSSQGSSSPRSIWRAPLGSSAGGKSAVTKPMCSPSRGANPLSLKASSTAGRARSRDSPCSLYGPASTITASNRRRSTRTRSEDPDLLGSVTLRRSSAKAQISCDSATPFLATPASICASSNDFCFCATLIGSCHKRASTSCAAMTGIVFSLATAGRVLTSDLDCIVDVAFITRGSQKFVDSRASSLTVIASKFIHIHADEFTSEFRVHIARVGKRMAQRLVSMRQAVIDAFANNFTEIVPDCQRDIFAHHIATQGQWQASFALPPRSEIDNLLKTGLRVGELPLVND